MTVKIYEGSIRHSIVVALLEMKSLNCDELARASQQWYPSVRGVLADMEREGVVSRNGRRRLNSRGFYETVFILPKGRIKMDMLKARSRPDKSGWPMEV